MSEEARAIELSAKIDRLSEAARRDASGRVVVSAEILDGLERDATSLQRRLRQVEQERRELREALRKCCLSVSPASAISDDDTHGLHTMVPAEVEIGVRELRRECEQLRVELRARSAVDEWLADAGLETRSLERHGDWLKVYEWKTANEGTRCFEVAEAETYEAIADALGLDWREP